MAGFLLLELGLSIELRSIIRLMLRLTPSGPAQALFIGADAPLSESGHHI
jgi:hypothetical protein